MANMHWIFQLVAVAFITAIDYSNGRALIGFVLAGFYLAASLYSLVRRDQTMFKRRAFLFAVFVAEVMVIASVIESPPDQGILENWIDRLAGQDYYKTK